MSGKWKTVPVEPNERMERMGAAVCCLSALDARDVYAEMLNTAPRPVATEEDVERVVAVLNEARCLSERTVGNRELSGRVLRALGWEVPHGD